jgi:hypothetical protein
MNKTITVNDKFQTNYIYKLTKHVGKEFDPEFQPQLTPKEMLEMGVFDGIYLNDCVPEFPSEWFDNAKLSNNGPNEKLNFFGIHASQSLKIWQQRGWIHQDDPRGWFQWYCRYFMGRRHEDDTRQIKRWKAMKRHLTQVKNNCVQGDWGCRARQRQALLHWAYDSRII